MYPFISTLSRGEKMTIKWIYWLQSLFAMILIDWSHKYANKQRNNVSWLDKSYYNLPWTLTSYPPLYLFSAINRWHVFFHFRWHVFFHSTNMHWSSNDWLVNCARIIMALNKQMKKKTLQKYLGWMKNLFTQILYELATIQFTIVICFFFLLLILFCDDFSSMDKNRVAIRMIYSIVSLFNTLW